MTHYFVEYLLHADKKYDQNELIIIKTSLFWKKNMTLLFCSAHPSPYFCCFSFE